MPMSIKHSGVWKDAEVHIKHSGVWKRAEVFVKQGGVWKQVAATVTFTPNGGLVESYVYHPGTASVTLTCNIPAVWSYSREGTAGSVNVANGGTASSITFNLISSSGSFRASTYYVSATANGITQSWTVQLTADNNS